MEYIWQLQKRNARFVEMNSTEQQKQKCAETHAELGSTGISKNKTEKVEVGSVWRSKNCGEFVVVEIENESKVHVQFLTTGTNRQTTSQIIKNGNIRDNLYPAIYGIGYISSGKYKPTHARKITPAYNCWFNMLTRCYNPKYQENKPTYIGCSVCDEWHNFQNFAEWYYINHPQDGKEWHLDKDLMVIGNKVYSPENCIFVPLLVNSFITDSAASRGRYRIGATFRKDSGNFAAECRDPFNRVSPYLGRHPDDLSAHLSWRRKKSQYCQELIDHYDSEVIKRALRNYKNALDNNLIHTY